MSMLHLGVIRVMIWMLFVGILGGLRGLGLLFCGGGLWGLVLRLCLLPNLRIIIVLG